MKVSKRVFYEHINSLPMDKCSTTVSSDNKVQYYYYNMNLVGDVITLSSGLKSYRLVEETSEVKGHEIVYPPSWKGEFCELLTIEQVLHLVHGNLSKASELLGTNRGTLRKKIKTITEPCILVKRDVFNRIIDLKLINHKG